MGSESFKSNQLLPYTNSGRWGFLMLPPIATCCLGWSSARIYSQSYLYQGLKVTRP